MLIIRWPPHKKVASGETSGANKGGWKLDVSLGIISETSSSKHHGVFCVFWVCWSFLQDSIPWRVVGPSYYGNLDKHDIVEMTCFASVSLGKELQRKSKQQDLNNRKYSKITLDSTVPSHQCFEMESFQTVPPLWLLQYQIAWGHISGESPPKNWGKHVLQALKEQWTKVVMLFWKKHTFRATFNKNDGLRCRS